MLRHRLAAALLAALMALTAGCSSEPETHGVIDANRTGGADTDDGPVADDVEVDDTMIATVLGTGELQIVLVNRENSKYLTATNDSDDSQRAARRKFADLPLAWHPFAARKIAYNRDMRDLAIELRKRAFDAYGEPCDTSALEPGNWGTQQPGVVMEVGGRLLKLVKQPSPPADIERRKAYVRVKQLIVMVTNRYKTYEVKRNVNPAKVFNDGPTVSPDVLKRAREQRGNR